MEVREDEHKLEEHNKHITPEIYAKWLTDKYNRDTEIYKNSINNLLAIVNKQKTTIKELTNRVKRLSNEKGEYNKELFKEEIIKKLTKEITKLKHTNSTIRRSNNELIAKLNKYTNT